MTESGLPGDEKNMMMVATNGLCGFSQLSLRVQLKTKLGSQFSMCLCSHNII
jgi:hypothetical protein